MVLARTRGAFNHADFVFELKYDGSRALAYVDGGAARLARPSNEASHSDLIPCAARDQQRLNRKMTLRPRDCEGRLSLPINLSY